MGNRDTWTVLDEELKELPIYTFKGSTKKEIKEAKKAGKLFNKLVNHCIKHFNDVKGDF